MSLATPGHSRDSSPNADRKRSRRTRCHSYGRQSRIVNLTECSDESDDRQFQVDDAPDAARLLNNDLDRKSGGTVRSEWTYSLDIHVHRFHRQRGRRQRPAKLPASSWTTGSDSTSPARRHALRRTQPRSSVFGPSFDMQASNNYSFAAPEPTSEATPTTADSDREDDSMQDKFSAGCQCPCGRCRSHSHASSHEQSLPDWRQRRALRWNNDAGQPLTASSSLLDQLQTPHYLAAAPPVSSRLSDHPWHSGFSQRQAQVRTYYPPQHPLPHPMHQQLFNYWHGASCYRQLVAFGGTRAF